MLKKFNLYCEEIIKEYQVYGRINLDEVDHELIKKLANDLRPDVKKQLERTGNPRIDQCECYGRFNDDRRQIVDVESYITGDKSIQDEILIPVDDESILEKGTKKRKLKDDPSILPILEELIEKALKEAAEAEYYYNYEKDWGQD